MTFYRCHSGMVCFRQVSRRADNGETDKSSCILIVTFLDLPIGEMKKKQQKCLSSFIT